MWSQPALNRIETLVTSSIRINECYTCVSVFHVPVAVPMLSAACLPLESRWSIQYPFYYQERRTTSLDIPLEWNGIHIRLCYGNEDTRNVFYRPYIKITHRDKIIRIPYPGTFALPLFLTIPLRGLGKDFMWGFYFIRIKHVFRLSNSNAYSP